MSTPLAEAQVGERYYAHHVRGGDAVLHVIAYEGKPWVAIDHSVLAPAAEWPGWEGPWTYEKIENPDD